MSNPDPIDQASDEEQRDRDRCIAAARMKLCEKEATATGFCLYCDAPLPEGVRFCDSDCRNDFSAQLNAAIRNGREQ